MFISVLILGLVAFATFLYLRSSQQQKQQSKLIKPLKTKPDQSSSETKKDDERFPLTILYGTQSGTTEGLAQSLKKEATQNNFKVKLVDLQNYDDSELENEKMVIFMVSTYGEGEPPDGAREFHDWLISDSHTEDTLSNVCYTVFGLGNSTFDHFNAMGKFFSSRLSEIGATCVYPSGEGDENNCLEDDFNNWKNGLWGSIGEHFSIPNFVEASRNSTYTRDSKLILHDNDFEIPSTKYTGKFDAKSPYKAPISSTRELHSSNSERSCLDIEFDLGNSLAYRPGDHLGVYPENQTSLVERLALRLKADLDQKFSLVSLETGLTTMGPCTIRHALTTQCDITSLPRKSLLKTLIEFASNPQEKELLSKISSNSVKDSNEEVSYDTWIKGDIRNIVEVLEDLPSIDISFDLLIEILPRLAPRYYSISSTRKVNPSSVHITAVHVKYDKPTGRVHDGVCTTFLREKHLNPNLKQLPNIPIFIRKSNFHLPTNPKTPIIMVGPGTGLAPFCGFIQDRKICMSESPQNTEFGEFILFFGCRDRNQDFIYQDELESAVKDNVLSHLFVAFSREGPEKVYVQHKMKDQAQLIWDVIDKKGGYLYVCGDANKMAKDVANTLHSIAMEKGNLTAKQSKDYWHCLQTCGRYLQDVWV